MEWIAIIFTEFFSLANLWSQHSLSYMKVFLKYWASEDTMSYCLANVLMENLRCFDNYHGLVSVPDGKGFIV